MTKLKNIAVLCALFISPLVFFNITDNPFYIQTPVLLLSLTVFFFCMVYEGKIQRCYADKYFLVFFTVCILSGAAALAVNKEFRLPLYYYFLNGLTLLLIYAGGYALGVQIKEDKLKKLFNLIFAAALLSSFYLILQAFGAEPFLPKGIGLTGTFGNPNFLAGFCLLVLPVCMFYFFTSTGAAKYFYFFVFVFSMGALILSNARSAWISFAGGLFLLLIFNNSRKIIWENKKSFLLLLLVPLIFLFLLPASQKQQMADKVKEPAMFIAEGKNKVFQSYHQRKLMWEAGLKILKEDPILGWGCGAWQLAYSQQQGALLLLRPEYKTLLTQANGAHNIVMQLLAECGFLGLGAFILFLVMLARKVGKRLKESSFKKTQGRQAFIVFMSAALLSFLADNLLNITFFIAAPAFFFWLFTGILACAADRGGKEIIVKSKFLKFIVFIFCAGLIVMFALRTQSEILTFKAKRAYKSGQQLAAENYFLKASKLYGGNVENYFYLGLTELSLGKKEAALAYFLHAARLNPAYEEAFFNAAITSYAVGDTQGFAQNIERVLQLNPFNNTAIALKKEFEKTHN